MDAWFSYLKRGFSRRLPDDPLAGQRGHAGARASLANLRPFLGRHWPRGLFGAVLILVSSLLSFPQPLLLAYLIDQVLEFRKGAPAEYWDCFGAVESDLPEEHHSTTWIGDRAVVLADVGKLIEFRREPDGQTVFSDMYRYLRHPFTGVGLAYKHGIPAAALHVTGLEILASWYRDAAAAQFGAPVRNRDVTVTAFTALTPAAAVAAALRVLGAVGSLEANQRPELAFAALFADLGTAT